MRGSKNAELSIVIDLVMKRCNYAAKKRINIEFLQRLCYNSIEVV